MKSTANKSLLLCVLMAVSAVLFPSSVLAQAVADNAPSDIAPRRQSPAKAPVQLHAGPAVAAGWAAVRTIALPPVDVDVLLAEDAVRDATPGVPKRIGVTRGLPGGPITPATAGAWVDLPDGSAVWLLRLDAADAKAIRLHFSQFDLEPGAEVRLTGVLEGVDAYRGKGPNDDGAFWAAATPGDVVHLEYFHPRGNRDVRLEIDVLSHFYRDPGFLPPQQQPNVPEDPEGLLACHESAMCHEVDVPSRDAVGLMIFDGGFLCSGALLNDLDANTFAGYFLTANHCINTQSSANSLTVYWFYQQSSCGGVVPPLSQRPKSLGAKLLSNSSATDFSFLRLNNDPEDAQGFAAWTLSAPSGTVHGIHHPSGSWKRYSLGATTGAGPFCFSQSLFVYNDWIDGATEGGSSGSPLFNTSWQVVGQLYGVCCSGCGSGCANCNWCTSGAGLNNMYGRFSQSYSSFSSYLNAIIPDDSYESNDTTVEAPGLAQGIHALRLVDYDDYFKVVFESDADVTLSATFSTTAMDLDLYLLDDVGGIVASSAGATNTEAVIATVPAGIYFIRAAKDNGWGGDYTLDFSAFLANCSPPATASTEVGGLAKNRFVAFVPDNPGAQTAIRVTMASLQHPDPPNQGAPPPDFSSFEGQSRWVGPPQAYTDAANPAVTFKAATLQCDPHFMDWGAEGLIHIYGAEILPSSEYDVAVILPDCDPGNESNFSSSLTVATGIWGDVAAPLQSPSPASRTQPDLGDVAALVDKFRGLATAPTVMRAMLQPNVPNPTALINFADISSCVDSFRGMAYPFSGPTFCP